MSTDMRLVREEGNERTYRDDESGHIVKMYTTPEGDELAKPLLMPDARSFSDVLEYLGEWDQFKEPRETDGSGRFRGSPPEPRIISVYEETRSGGHQTAASKRGNKIGPFCTFRNAGKHRSIAVRATDAVIDAVRGWIVTPDDNLSFEIILHEDRNRALVILQHGYIIGSHWLAYIDPATIPAYPYERRDERFRGVCDAIKDEGLEPFVRHLPGGEIEVSIIVDRGRAPDFRRTLDPKRKAIIRADGHITRTWPDGSVSEGPPL